MTEAAISITDMQSNLAARLQQAYDESNGDTETFFDKILNIITKPIQWAAYGAAVAANQTRKAYRRAKRAAAKAHKAIKDFSNAMLLKVTAFLERHPLVALFALCLGWTLFFTAVYIAAILIVVAILTAVAAVV